MSHRLANKKKLSWKARRGMKELDLLLSSFVTMQSDLLNDEQLQRLETLLEYDDPTLYDWLVLGQGTVVPKLEEMVERIVTFAASRA